jgi:hypothetical protein
MSKTVEEDNIELVRAQDLLLIRNTPKGKHIVL